MQLTHIALWTNHLERLRDFYVKYFNGKSNEKYVNPKKGFASYFVSFESGPALEIMQRQDITEAYDKDHIGLSCGYEGASGSNDRTFPDGWIHDRR